MSVKWILSVLCCVAVLPFADPARAASPVILKLATSYEVGTPVSDALHTLKEQLESRTNGKYQLDLYEGSQYGSSTSAMQALQAGNLQMVVESTGNAVAFSKGLLIFDMPFVMERYDNAMEEVLFGPIGKEMLDSASTKRMIAYAFMGCAPRTFYTTRPVRNLEEAKGLKMRVTPSKGHLASMKALGMAPTPMAMSEVYTSLQQGVIEGVDPLLVTGELISLPAVAPYRSKYDINACAAMLFLNRAWWNKIAKEDQALFSELLQGAAQKTIQISREEDEKIIKELAEKGTPVFIPSEQERARWIEATKDVYKDFPDVPEKWILDIRKVFATK